MAEVEEVRQRFAPDHLWFADDIFGLPPRWTGAFAEGTQGTPIPFRIQSRCDLMTTERVAALALAGCTEVWMGVESGSQKILDAMDKGTKVEHIHTARENLRQHGIRACYFLQFGYLGETKEDIEATMQMVEDLLPHDIGISVSYPLPGTKFHEKVRDLLGEKQNWSVSDDLAMMYPATFPPAYYRRLHRLVHKRFRLQQGRAEWQKIFAGQKANLHRAARMFYYAPAGALDAWRLQRLAKPNPHVTQV